MVGRHILEDIVGRVAHTIFSAKIAPHTSHLVKLLYAAHNKCRIGPLAAAPPDTCAVVISTETESGFITEDDVSSLSHSKLPEVGKNPVDTAYDVGSVVSVLADVGSSSQLSSPYGFS
ncbi:hypothetical protein TNCV_394811 [Trichonephila clavipes]|nr:hypothetical protein TNCV_394811 [Trichonephila clavipes]